MGWENRSGRLVYYRKFRRGNRVVSRHCGGGDFAVLLAQIDAEARAAREAERLEHRAARDAWETHNRRIVELCRAVDDVVRTVLVSIGYHQHHREWRKRRVMGPPALPAPTAAELDQVVKKTRDGMVSLAITAEIVATAGDDKAFFRNLRAQVNQLLSELLGPAPSTLERLLGERVALVWLQLHRLELLAADAERKRLAARNELEKRRDRAHRRYLQAIKSLAQIRKLALPAIQVNIGQQQAILAQTQHSCHEPQSNQTSISNVTCAQSG
jgi:hypothetical protein